ncbi:MAG: sigma 54-interacting transcriptional regulator [Deltaproteobacteria bacterium]|nr:sigma 54-interacting transcriptional regulator [Deltaproteobacteria bacterium]
MSMPDATDAALSASTEVGGGAATSAATAVLVPAGNAALGGRTRSELGAAPPFSVGSQGVLFGRKPHGHAPHVFALSHPQASGQHAWIRSVEGFWLADNNSTNGTFLNGRRLSAPAPLRDGDWIYAGGEAFVFRWANPQELEAIDGELLQPFGPVPTRQPRFARLLRRLRFLAETTSELLLVGETGVGKEVYARAVHEYSQRKGAFVAINCAAIPAELVESELFGFMRGAHSQAKEGKAGVIAEAHGGTLLLDEIGDMPATAQAKLLRFVQTKEVWPLGATSARKVDVRIIGATSHLLAQTGAPGVREELMARLGANPPVLPPLCDRREDIGELIAHFMGKAVKPIDAAAFLALMTYPWPRNVRELEAVIKEALVFSKGEATVTREHLPPFVTQATPPTAPQTVAPPPQMRPVAPTEEVRRVPRAMPSREELEALLEQYRGNVNHVARKLEREWKVVKRAVDRYGIDLTRFRT